MAEAGGETTWKVSGLAVGPNRQSTGRGLMGIPSSACQTLRQHYLSLARMDSARATPFSQRQLSPFAGRDAADSSATCKSTRTERIGWYFRDGSRHRARSGGALSSIAAWARHRAIDVVIWTDLPSNFQEATGQPFSVAAAQTHLDSLAPGARAGAVEYLERAPAFIDTPLRRAWSDPG